MRAWCAAASGFNPRLLPAGGRWLRPGLSALSAAMSAHRVRNHRQQRSVNPKTDDGCPDRLEAWPHPAGPRRPLGPHLRAGAAARTVSPL